MESFYGKCYQILRKVPKGKVTTYKEIAKVLNSKGYRAVGTAMNKNPHSFIANAVSSEALSNRRSALRGTAMNKNPYAPLTPCHRVINSNGKVGKFAHGTRKKTEMLNSEGIKIINGKIDLKKYGFKFT
ncbi:MAG: MGMT family protein [Nanoarchaeota archaeon]|nr:MGMT family protein [Nanoarchaeota archaeon]